MPSTILGLPIHPLLVHATVVSVPLAAVLVLGAVLVPRFRAWAGPLPAGVSLLALILTPLSTATGEHLEHELPHSQLIEEHAHLGDQLLPLTTALWVLSTAFWWFTRGAASDPTTPEQAAGSPSTSWLARVPTRVPRAVLATVGSLALVAAVGTGVQVIRIGHSGAKAAWSDVGSADGS